jgi:hypothetical protein
MHVKGMCHKDKVKQDTTNISADSANISSGSGVTEKKKPRKTLLLHHSATNRRPPLGCMSPVTIDSSDGD